MTATCCPRPILSLHAPWNDFGTVTWCSCGPVREQQCCGMSWLGGKGDAGGCFVATLTHCHAQGSTSGLSRWRRCWVTVNLGKGQGPHGRACVGYWQLEECLKDVTIFVANAVDIEALRQLAEGLRELRRNVNHKLVGGAYGDQDLDVIVRGQLETLGNVILGGEEYFKELPDRLLAAGN